MNLEQFLTKHQPIPVEVYVIVSELLKCSKSHARRLVEQGGVSVQRNGAMLPIGSDDMLLLGDVLRIGKGKFYQL